jgi:hypothetical protein
MGMGGKGRSLLSLFILLWLRPLLMWARKKKATMNSSKISKAYAAISQTLFLSADSNGISTGAFPIRTSKSGSISIQLKLMEGQEEMFIIFLKDF